MAHCTVKRQATVTLVLSEDEARVIQTLLTKTTGDPGPDGFLGENRG